MVRKVEPRTGCKTTATFFRWVPETCPASSEHVMIEGSCPSLSLLSSRCDEFADGPGGDLRDGAGLSDSRRCSTIPEPTRRISGPLRPLTRRVLPLQREPDPAARPDAGAPPRVRPG